ncbi:sigma-70 family RNA polymerase sigma factor [Streptomyces sp. NPDC048606]|uniref:sigma-70 family RNA polymerase sigma factor n=1 Tax=Streptomyces sp. NPDC048606 TaxID=3154726 RepID=UPI00344692A3
MQKVAHGDKQAFAVLYDALSPLVFGIVLRVVRDRAQSEEVAQEVMIDLWRQAARYRPESASVRTWAATIAHRRAVDRVRSAQAATDREHARAAREHTPAFDEVGPQPSPSHRPSLPGRRSWPPSTGYANCRRAFPSTPAHPPSAPARVVVSGGWLWPPAWPPRHWVA